MLLITGAIVTVKAGLTLELVAELIQLTQDILLLLA
jgi:hypothetical protein